MADIAAGFLGGQNLPPEGRRIRKQIKIRTKTTQFPPDNLGEPTALLAHGDIS